jgi:hypothetical protein
MHLSSYKPSFQSPTLWEIRMLIKDTRRNPSTIAYAVLAGFDTNLQSIGY